MSSGAVLINHSLIQPLGSITYFGSASVPVDNGSNGSSPMTVTPPASMVVGDFVYVKLICGSAGPRTASIPVTGGQTWTLFQDRAGAIPELWTAWCRFNGTWSANPQFAISGTAVMKSSIMHVFRPPVSGMSWAADVAPVQSSVGGTATPSITGITNTQNKNLSIASFVNSTASFVITATGGANWASMGSVQYRNNGANNRLASFAYQVQGFGVAVGATGNVSKTLSSPATWFNTIQSWYCF